MCIFHLDARRNASSDATRPGLARDRLSSPPCGCKDRDFLNLNFYRLGEQLRPAEGYIKASEHAKLDLRQSSKKENQGKEKGHNVVNSSKVR